MKPQLDLLKCRGATLGRSWQQFSLRLKDDPGSAAVALASNRLDRGRAGAFALDDGLPISNRRYSRLAVGATFLSLAIRR